MLQVANGGGLHPARDIAGGDFLQLVRLGIRAADDPIVLDSVRVLDQVLKRDLPQGPCWRRYNRDGYGQKDDGSAFDGTGVGRSWPLLAGERGHYALASGGDALPFITAMERFANEGGMLTEQLWDDEDLPDAKMLKGQPTGASMPLCWSHAEYLALVRSRHDGVAFDRVGPAFQRYVVQPVKSRHEFWSFRHPPRQMPRGKILRLVNHAKAEVVWSSNGWQDVQRTRMTLEATLGLWFADLPTTGVPAGTRVEFTFFWEEGQRWEGRNFEVAVTP
jgi:glucoamylase